MVECTQAPKRGNDCTLSLDHHRRDISRHATSRRWGCDGGEHSQEKTEEAEASEKRKVKPQMKQTVKERPRTEGRKKVRKRRVEVPEGNDCVSSGW